MRHRTRAQALLWLTLIMPTLIGMAGLAIDGAMLLSAHRQLQSVADGAARAAATRVDLDRLRASGGADVQLDATVADATARQYLAEQFARELVWDTQPQVTVAISARRAHVVVQGVMRTAFLRVVHIESAPLEASAFADIRFGIRDGGGV